MAYDFPNTPTVGQVYSGWVWDGEKWQSQGSATQGAVRYDIAQGLTASQKQVGRANIDAANICECGRLIYASANIVRFNSFKGAHVKINGLFYIIPAAGIDGNRTGTFINGVSGQNLAANATYYVNVFVNSGVLTIDFVNNKTHVASGTPGNEGVEIMNGDDTRTFIGFISTNASAQFENMRTLSWFNRQNKANFAGYGAQGTNVAQIPFCCWADEHPMIGFSAYMTCNIASTNWAQHNVDGGTVGPQFLGTVAAAGFSQTYASTLGVVLAEGLHTYGVNCAAGGGLTAIQVYSTVMTRG